jgi:hypothetical protein
VPAANHQANTVSCSFITARELCDSKHEVAAACLPAVSGMTALSEAAEERRRPSDLTVTDLEGERSRTARCVAVAATHCTDVIGSSPVIP